jgi:hypothetical protein
VPAAPSSSSLDFVVLKDVKASGTDGPALTLNTWNTRHINTEETDTGNICTLSNNQFTLPAGTYHILAVILTGGNAAFRQAQFRLRNITNNSNTLFGLTFTVNISATVSSPMGVLTGIFTINAPETFEIQEYPKSGTGAAVAGYAANVSGFSECYLTAVITKIA